MSVHGGDVWQVAEEWNLRESDLLDFSANISPRGLPPRARLRLAEDAGNQRLLARYPDPDARELRDALAEAVSVARESIMVGEGASALLSAAVRALEPRRVVTAVPAFAEYGRVCESIHAHLNAFRLEETNEFRLPVEEFCREIGDGFYDLAILNNPHNPSGALLSRAEVLRIFEAAKEAGVVLLVDEAFIDYVPEASVTEAAARLDRLIVVRSLTKFYGCPALRVGYAVATPAFATRVAAQLPAWPVSIPAMNALAEAVRDREFADTTRAANERESERLAQRLRELGLRVYPSAANYLLIRLPEPSAADLRRRLVVEHGILVRDCSSFEGLEDGRFIRVAVLSETDNDRLISALRQTHGAARPR